MEHFTELKVKCQKCETECELLIHSALTVHLLLFGLLFQILTHNILVTLAVNFPADFTAEVHVAVDKFLAALSAALADKYRLTHHSGASRASANRGTSNDKAKVSDAINKISNNRKGFFFMFFSRSI